VLSPGHLVELFLLRRRTQAGGSSRNVGSLPANRHEVAPARSPPPPLFPFPDDPTEQERLVHRRSVDMEHYFSSAFLRSEGERRLTAF